MILVFPFIGLAHYFLGNEFSEKVKLYGMKVWAASFYTFGIWFYHKGSIEAQKSWPKGPVIIIANHNSLLDTPAIYLMLSRFALPLAKIELTKPFLFGNLCKWLTLPVDRRSGVSRQQALADMNSYLSRGGSLVIFPEGKTNKTNEPFTNFESGAFRLSIELGIPIVPILIRNSRYCLASTKPMTLSPGIVTTESGPVFSPNDYSSPDQMGTEIYNWYLAQDQKTSILKNSIQTK